jgi:hypothetical protein
VHTLVWILAAIFLMNVLAVGWLLALELVERRRLDKEIRQVDALWRYLTTPLSATVAWGARSRQRVTALHPQQSGAGKAWIGLAVAASVVWVAAVVVDPATQRQLTSARGVVFPAVSPELEKPRVGVSSTQGVKKDGTRVSPQSPGETTSSAPNPSIATSDDITVPATVAAQPNSSTAIHIVWEQVPVATGYAIERKQDKSQSGWRTIIEVEEDVTAYTDVGLAAHTTYFYRVSALMDDGAAPPSDIVSATTPIAVPAATEVTAVATLDTIALTWTDVADETGYRVERSPDGTTGWVELATTGQDVTTYVNATLSPDTTYFYRVIATNDGGDSPASNVASATTEAPSPVIEGAAPATEAPAAGGLQSVDADPATPAGLLAADTPAAGGALAVTDPATTDPATTEPAEIAAPAP